MFVLIIFFIKETCCAEALHRFAVLHNLISPALILPFLLLGPAAPLIPCWEKVCSILRTPSACIPKGTSHLRGAAAPASKSRNI